MISEMLKCGEISIILKYGTFSITEVFLNFKSRPGIYWSVRQEKVTSEDSSSAHVETLYGLASTYFVSFHPFSSSSSLSLQFHTFIAFIPHQSRSSGRPILAFHPSVPLCVSFHPLALFVQLLKTRECSPVVMSPSLTLVQWSCGRRVSCSHFHVMVYFLNFFLFVWFFHVLILFVATCNCVQCLPHRNHIILVNEISKFDSSLDVFWNLYFHVVNNLVII